MISEKLKQKIAAWVKHNHYNPYELYADYNDEIDDKQIAKFLKAENPREAFEDYMEGIGDEDESYYLPDAFIEAEFDITKECRKEFGIDSKIDDNELRECLWDCGMSVGADLDHFRNQDVLVDVFLTNDEEENYEHTLNCIYPQHYAGESQKIEDINNHASLLWLAKQQGYNKRQFYSYMHETPSAPKSKFLASVREELLNKWTEMSQVVFLQEYTLGELLDIMTNKASIQIPVGTICGLFDDWHGEGSILEIKLEKPVVVPYGRFELRPAHSYKYNVDEVYGLCWDAWKRAA